MTLSERLGSRLRLGATVINWTRAFRMSPTLPPAPQIRHHNAGPEPQSDIADWRVTPREAAMTTLTADPRLTMWHQRAAAQNKLATLRVYRASICGCGHCDEPDPAKLDMQIRDELATVAYLSERLCERHTC